MNRFGTDKTFNKYRRGITLIEVILSLAILAIIIFPFLNMFTQSTLTNKKSSEIIDAAYLAQNIMEDLYEKSLVQSNPIPITESKEYIDPLGDRYWVIQKVSNENNLVRVIVKVYKDNTELDLKAQMETYFLWN